MLKNWWKIIFIISLMIFLLNHSYNIKINSSNQNYTQGLIQALDWIKENTTEKDVILSDWFYGPNIVSYAKRKIIATTKVYPSESEFLAERYKDMAKFFLATDEHEAMEVVRKYGIDYIFAPRNFNFKTCKYIMPCNTSNKNISLKSETFLIIRKMQRGERLYFFEKLYDSQYFKIYKVKDKPSIGLNINFSNNHLSNNQYTDVKGAIIPHHITYAHPMISDLLSSLKSNYRTIFLLGPDHINITKNKITTSDTQWNTKYGSINPDIKKINQLNLEIDNSGHLNEWSVKHLLPFIKYYLPDAKVVPILLKKETTPEEAKNLGEKLSKYDNSLILISLDLSHNIFLNEALKNDNKTIETIQSFDLENIYSLDIDSKPSLFTLLSSMENQNFSETILLNYTNSGLMKVDYPKNVGYTTMVFK